MSGRKVIILYGSQTGTAQDIAEQIWRNSKMYHLQGNVMAMDDYDVKSLIDEQFAILVVSTTGQGEEPDNMVKFWKFLLRKNLQNDSLCDLNFAVLGLGDSRYPKFNFVAKKLHKRLMQLGATPLQSVGCCDEQHDIGYNAVYMPWINNVWNRICEINPIPAGLHKLAETPRQFRWNVENIGENNSMDIYYEPFSDWHLDQYVETKVIDNKRITPVDHFQDVRMISFEKTKNMSWSPGDIIYIRPRNSMENVDRLFQIFEEHNLGFTRNTVIAIKEFDSEMHVPPHLKHKVTLENLAIYYWDLNAIPRARTFELLALNCQNELEKEKLQEFCSIEGQEDLYAYANRPRRTMIEIMSDFTHATSALDIKTLFELFQPIKPRPFSIASSDKSGQMDLLVAVIEYKTKLSTPRKGICSNWLKRLVIGDKVSFSIRRGTFKLPLDQSIPLIMVGPGTGLAGFRAILQEREKSDEKSGPLVLFFGCRFKKADFHCAKDLLRMEQNGLLKLFCAFSREQENKVYVQHLIRKEGELLKDLIVNKNGYIYVSGSSKNMPQDVMEAFIEAIGDSNLIEELKKNEKYQEETWQ